MDELSALDALACDFVAPAQSVPKVGLLLDSYVLLLYLVQYLPYLFLLRI